MHIAHPFVVILLVSSAPAWAQSASAPSLNLQLPAGAAPAQSDKASESKANPDSGDSTAQATASEPVLPEPYDEPYGTRRDAQNGCEDSTYAQPQVHGSIGMGVVSGNHISGNYQTGKITASKALGSCDDPKGFVSASIRVTKGNVNFRRGSP